MKKGRLLTRRPTDVFGTLCSYSISLRDVRVAAPVSPKPPQWPKRRRTVCQSGLTCDQYVSLSRLSITNQCRQKTNERGEVFCPRLSGWGQRFFSSNHEFGEEGRRRVGSASWPRIGCVRWNPLTSMSLAGTRGVCQLCEREANMWASCANRMTHGVLNIWTIWTDAMWIHWPTLFIVLCKRKYLYDGFPYLT